MIATGDAQLNCTHAPAPDAGACSSIDCAKEQLAIDLHDSVGSRLTAVHLLAQSLARELAPIAPSSALKARTIADHLADTAQAVRQICGSRLCGDLSLREKLNQLVARFEAAGVHLALQNCTPLEALAPDAQDNLLHIIEEATANAIRHGHAREIRLAIVQENRYLSLTLTNDGAPWSPHAQPHVGLRSIQLRARKLGADLKFLTAGSRETGLRMHIPLSTNVQP